jgi:hypothetical protein
MIREMRAAEPDKPLVYLSVILSSMKAFAEDMAGDRWDRIIIGARENARQK